MKEKEKREEEEEKRKNESVGTSTKREKSGDGTGIESVLREFPHAQLASCHALACIPPSSAIFVLAVAPVYPHPR